MIDQISLPEHTTEELAALSPIELTDILIEHEDRAPRNVIDECARRNEAMVAHLHSLHDCDYLWQPDAGSGVWWLRLHAAMILGLILTESAGLLLVDLMRRMSLEDDDNLQDWLAGYWPALFRNKPESVQPALRKLCEDSSLYWYIRANAIETAMELAAQQGGSLLEQALSWLASIAANENEDWALRLSTACELLDHPRTEYRPLLEDLAARQTGFGRHFTMENVQEAYEKTIPSGKLDRFKNPWQFYEPEAIAKRQQRWREEIQEMLFE